MTRAPAPVVRTIGVARTYGRGADAVCALSDVDLSFSAGEVIALRGRSGSGKTTLLNLLGLLDRPSQGRVVFNGLETQSWPDRRRALMRRGQLGYVLQDSGVIERMSALDNVMLPTRYAGLPARKGRALALAALDSVDLQDKAARLVGKLSGGERMRVGLARALVLSPNLIICDEPTASLDAETAERVINRLTAAARANACIISATHDPIVIRRATRTIAMSAGRVVEDTALSPTAT